MKFKVSYYDSDADSVVEKNCEEIHFSNKSGEDSFSFMPVDDPPRIYKPVIIDSPNVSISLNRYGFQIRVEGYQYNLNSGGYCKTITTISKKNEE